MLVTPPFPGPNRWRDPGPAFQILAPMANDIPVGARQAWSIRYSGWQAASEVYPMARCWIATA